ncbi:hypothetical protein EIN_046640 [Entamoeba invadens IP1]|uniref:Uncharacterized protein n=1 Tax=Entamoeba invadens IP1 TaxID=370355 RepID=A0A0A1UDK1_ENTIV|nr:hypothetical protein EIN_046640 [Entamoeba invadens IP1]ELP94411.1 hypothetical protein EIN_046640 [Entamoeba invadens IP1]|eukprot:XP_004261182.1 hypothetical protein EIN_046640 [Entamoeba invadens IP1]
MILINILALLVAVDSHHDPCVNEFSAMDITKAETHNGLIPRLHVTYTCYSEIENYQIKVAAHLSKQLCYFHKWYKFFNFHGKNISRCGQFFEITGPTQVPYHCMFAGTFESDSTDEDQEYYTRNIVLVNGLTMGHLTTMSAIEPPVFTKISLRASDAPFELLAKVTAITFNSTDIQMVVYDNSRPIQSVLVNDDEYFQNENGAFNVKRKKSIIDTVKFVAIDGEIFLAYVTTLFRIGDAFAQNPLTQIKDDQVCSFTPNPILFDEEQTTSKYDFSSWKILTVSGTNSTTYISHDKSVDFVMSDTEISIYFLYTTKFMVWSTYRFLLCDFSATSQVVLDRVFLTTMNYSDTFSVININPPFDQCSNMSFVLQNSLNSSQSLEYKYQFYSFMTRRCPTSNNVIGVVLKGTKGSIIRLQSTSLEENMTIVSSCRSASLECGELQCNPYETFPESFVNVGFTRDCFPADCGRCKYGYNCTAQGKCEKVNNKMTSSSALSYVVVLLLFTLFVI